MSKSDITTSSRNAQHATHAMTPVISAPSASDTGSSTPGVGSEKSSTLFFLTHKHLFLESLNEDVF